MTRPDRRPTAQPTPRPVRVHGASAEPGLTQRLSAGATSPLVGLRQAERMLGYEVEDHLLRNRAVVEHPHDPEVGGELVFDGDAVATVDAERSLERLKSSAG